MPNKQRGEVAVRLNGKSWTMRPTFEALAQVEDLTNRSLQILTTEIAMGTARARDYAVLFYACAKAFDSKAEITISEIGEGIMAGGGIGKYDEQITALFKGLIRFYSVDVDDAPDEDEQKKSETT